MFRRIHIDVLTTHDPKDFPNDFTCIKAVFLDLLHLCPHASARDSALIRVIEVSAQATLEQLVFEDEAAKEAAVLLGMDESNLIPPA